MGDQGGNKADGLLFLKLPQASQKKHSEGKEFAIVKN
jgi:hypothetical protein